MRRGIGPGPVFVYETITAARRWQTYGLRAAFLGALLLATLLVWQTATDGAHTIQVLARTGQAIFVSMAGTQIVLILLAAPAATAGAICLDRSRGTLTHMLVTDLSSTEIVLGKLGSRLLPILALIGCTLPVMAILTLLGGIDPDAVWGATVVSFGVAVLGCSLAMFFSIFVRRTPDALMATYAIWAFWVLGELILRSFLPPLWMDWVRELGLLPPAGGPFALMMRPYTMPGAIGLGDYAIFLAWTLGLSCIAVLIAIVRLRPECAESRAGRKFRLSIPQSRMFPWKRLGPGFLSPSLESNPVLWREWHRSRPSTVKRFVSTTYGVLALIYSFNILYWSSRTGQTTAVLVNGFQVAIGLLLLSVSAATSLSEERTRGSLDVLMATPLSTSSIVMGKWLGAYRFVPLLAILPTLVVLASSGWRRIAIQLASCMFAYVLVTGAAVVSLGVLMATWNVRLGRAVAMTVGVYILGVVIPIFFEILFDAEEVPMASPFLWAGLTGAYFLGLSMLDLPEFLAHSSIWLIANAIAAVALLGLTLLTFNRCMGRVEHGAIRRRRPPDQVSPALR